MALTITKDALDAMTAAQKEAVLRLYNDRVKEVAVSKGLFDLPDGYLTFAQHYEGSGSIYGGIAPNGDVST